jgi:hypothetical protein
LNLSFSEFDWPFLLAESFARHCHIVLFATKLLEIGTRGVRSYISIQYFVPSPGPTNPKGLSRKPATKRETSTSDQSDNGSVSSIIGQAKEKKPQFGARDDDSSPEDSDNEIANRRISKKLEGPTDRSEDDKTPSKPKALGFIGKLGEHIQDAQDMAQKPSRDEISKDSETNIGGVTSEDMDNLLGVEGDDEG